MQKTKENVAILVAAQSTIVNPLLREQADAGSKQSKQSRSTEHTRAPMEGAKVQRCCGHV